MALTRLFPILLLSGCAVQWSPDYTVRKDVLGNEYYEVTVGAAMSTVTMLPKIGSVVEPVG